MKLMVLGNSQKYVSNQSVGYKKLIHHIVVRYYQIRNIAEIHDYYKEKNVFIINKIEFKKKNYPLSLLLRHIGYIIICF